MNSKNQTGTIRLKVQSNKSQKNVKKEKERDYILIKKNEGIIGSYTSPFFSPKLLNQLPLSVSPVSQPSHQLLHQLLTLWQSLQEKNAKKTPYSPLPLTPSELFHQPPHSVLTSPFLSSLFLSGSPPTLWHSPKEKIYLLFFFFTSSFSSKLSLAATSSSPHPIPWPPKTACFQVV